MWRAGRQRTVRARSVTESPGRRSNCKAWRACSTYAMSECFFALHRGKAMTAVRVTAFFLAAAGCAICAAQGVVPGAALTGAPEAKDMVQIGYHDLQARSAYQPVV